jgi:glycosyltransferase involved in cell wall biosynthesis
MRVLLVSPKPPPTGGIASWTINLLDYMASNPHGIEVFHQDTSLKYRNIIRNSLITRMYYGFIESIRIIHELKVNIRKYSPEIIHLTSSSSLALIKDYFILRIARKNKIPVIIHWHFGRIPSLSRQGNWEWKFLGQIIQHCQTSIVIDNQSYHTLVKEGFKNVVNVPNPIGLDLEQKSRMILPLNGHRQQGRLLFVGHIIQSKGVFELVESCIQLPIIKELSLIGPVDPLVKQELEKLASKRDNGNWLKFHGTMDNNRVLEEMRNSAILVLPSYTEGFPLVVIEAMAMGSAVIATNVGAIPEILAISTDAPCGTCIPVKNIAELQDAIQALAQDASKTAVMGKNGIDRVLSNYTIEKVAEQYITVWANAKDNSFLHP